MERPTPLILPEGFVRNTDDIYQEVASYPIVPPEKLWQYWHVYTTTFRRLIDPTASRLENFWWHVLGSDRRFLSGKALAKIYEEISTGPSFAPLRGPPNRFHTPLPRITQQEVDKAGYGTNAQPEASQGPVEVPRKAVSEQSVTKEPMSSSSARPPPPHPILKKSRGPSASGPRPTARFVSPHDSEEEAARDIDASSGSLGATGLEMRRPATKSPAKGEKKSTPTGRKFTASTAAKRHRPALPRRQSSQSSVLSEASTKVASSASVKGISAGAGPVSREQHLTASPASSGSSTLVNSPGLSAKAAGKRPMRASPDKRRNHDQGPDSSLHTPDRVPPVVIVQQQHEAARPPANSPEREKSAPNQSLEAGQDRCVAKPETPKPRPGIIPRAHVTAPMMARSQSNIENQRHRPRDASLGPPLPQSLITPKSVAVTKKAADVAVQVQFDSDSVTAQGDGGVARDLPDSIAIASRPSSSSLYTPTQPSPTPDIPLGRSKSQLTLLLERHKDRNGDLQAKSRSGR